MKRLAKKQKGTCSGRPSVGDEASRSAEWALNGVSSVLTNSKDSRGNEQKHETKSPVVFCDHLHPVQETYKQGARNEKKKRGQVIWPVLSPSEAVHCQ